MIKFGRPILADVEALLPRFVEEVVGDDRLDALWLFGSRARNEADALSDIDLAALAVPRLSTLEMWDAQLDWTSLAVKTLGTDEVLVQLLNRVPVAIRDPILRHARLLWARSPEIAADFAAVSLKEYLDLKPYLERYDRDLFRQAITGSLR